MSEQGVRSCFVVIVILVGLLRENSVLELQILPLLNQSINQFNSNLAAREPDSK